MVHVWGIGLTRTGTKSLCRALCCLGYTAIHWPTTRQLLYDWIEAATDESVAALYRTLDAKYPGSKFILTERSEDEWLRSTRAQRHRFAAVASFLDDASGRDSSLFDRNVEVQFTQTALYGTLRFDEARYRRAFKAHYEGVEEYFADRPDDLLRLRICDGEGWEHLCRFLRLPPPAAPFPHVNRTAFALNSGNPDRSDGLMRRQ
jgi:hypothetical protein